MKAKLSEILNMKIFLKVMNKYILYNILMYFNLSNNKNKNV